MDGLGPTLRSTCSAYPMIDGGSLSVLEDTLWADRDAVWKLLEIRHQNLLGTLEEMFMSIDCKPTQSIMPVLEGVADEHVEAQDAKPHMNILQSISDTQVIIKEESNLTTSQPAARNSNVNGEDMESETQNVSTPVARNQLGEHCSQSLQESRPSKKTGFSIRTRRTSERSITSDYLRYAKRVAKSNEFELVFAILIVLNATVMCVEAQYWGFDAGHEAGFPHTSEGSVVWPGAEVVFKILDWLFGLAFTVEVLVKFLAFRRRFWLLKWNLFDAFIVASWILGIVFEGMLPVNPFSLRVVRLIRLVRIMRLAKTFQVFDSLHLMAASLSASISVLLWSVVLLIAIMVTSALVMTSVMGFYITDKSNTGSRRMLAYEYFGNFTRSLLSVFEVTLGNFTPITRFLHEDVSEFFGIVIMMYHCVVSFAIVMVIRGVFLHETFQAAATDDDLMILRQMRTKAKTIKKINLFFSETDESGDGVVSYEEFMEAVRDERVQAWLAAMGLDVSEAETVFQLMDDGDNRISTNELVSGISMLQGFARSKDLIQVLRLLRNVVADVENISAKVGCKRASSSSLLSASMLDISDGFRHAIVR